jgi:rare lipoprotein A (peptidoglycan hydrolase)
VIVFALLGPTAGGAWASDGGVAPPGDDGGYVNARFGSRDLSMGMQGDDVKTLNWVLNGVAGAAPFHGRFEQPTDGSVRHFQRAAGLSVDGVVGRSTRKAIAKRMPAKRATWYGPGFWGNRTACGKVLKTRTIGVAHRKLPCGTRVTFAYRGRWVRARVIDRGPYRRGYGWDLTRKLAKRLGFLYDPSPGRVKAAVAR